MLDIINHCCKKPYDGNLELYWFIKSHCLQKRILCWWSLWMISPRCDNIVMQFWSNDQPWNLLVRTTFRETYICKEQVIERMNHSTPFCLFKKGGPCDLYPFWQHKSFVLCYTIFQRSFTSALYVSMLCSFRSFVDLINNFEKALQKTVINWNFTDLFSRTRKTSEWESSALLQQWLMVEFHTL